MNEENGFALKPEMYSQIEWYQMFLSILKEFKKIQQENARLKDKIEKSIMYIENTYDDVVSSFTEDKPMTNFKARKELLEILKEN